MRQEQWDLMARFEAMAVAYQGMRPWERAELHAWERRHLDGATVGTHDWPGWDRYLGQITLPAPKPSRPERPKAHIPGHIRWAVWERDDFRCQECGARRYLAVDHIVPESKGGTLALDNLQTLCQSCNSKKGARV